MIKKLLLSKFKILDFYNLTIVKKQELPFYGQIINATNKQIINGLIEYPEPINLKNNIHYITYVPPFVNVVLNEGLKKKSFHRLLGYLANLENHSSIQGYMTKQFGSKSRSKMRSYLKRLETCFNVTYKFYYGNIDHQNYLNLFDDLRLMVERRFNQRGEEHQAIKDWEYYKETAYSYILEKKASLFVIYDNEKPIDICLNFHFNNILINYIRAYDIDYSKFRLGYLDILKQLEWCFDNNISIFDLGAGSLNYKKQWCNQTYVFENHIIFNNKHILNIVLGNIFMLTYRLRMFLEEKNILKTLDNKTQKPPHKNIQQDQTLEDTFKFEITDLNKKGKLNINGEKINIENEKYKFLRETIYEYLYLNFEHKDNISVYINNENPNNYILIGKKNVELKRIN